MKAATAGQKAAWYPVPDDVVSARVCRMSGKLATPGCEQVPVVSKSGEMQIRSMAYYEYFKRGTEPNEPCDLHGSPSLFNRIVGLFSGSGLQPVPESVVPPAPSPTTGERAPAIAQAPVNTPAAASQDEAPKKKRGFWSRLFGFGKKDKDKDKNKNNGEDKDKDPEK